MGSKAMARHQTSKTKRRGPVGTRHHNSAPLKQLHNGSLDRCTLRLLKQVNRHQKTPAKLLQKAHSEPPNP